MPIEYWVRLIEKVRFISIVFSAFFGIMAFSVFMWWMDGTPTLTAFLVTLPIALIFLILHIVLPDEDVSTQIFERFIYFDDN